MYVYIRKRIEALDSDDTITWRNIIMKNDSLPWYIKSALQCCINLHALVQYTKNVCTRT